MQYDIKYKVELLYRLLCNMMQSIMYELLYNMMQSIMYEERNILKD